MDKWELWLNRKMYSKLLKELQKNIHYKITIESVMDVPIVIDDEVKDGIAELRNYGEVG